jgi:hypothetical protein
MINEDGKPWVPMEKGQVEKGALGKICFFNCFGVQSTENTGLFFSWSRTNADGDDADTKKLRGALSSKHVMMTNWINLRGHI